MFPVNIGGVHWVFTAVDIRTKEIIYFDSMADAGEEGNVTIAESTKKWYLTTYELETGEALNADEWNIVYNPCYYPKQTDHASCGLLTIYMMEYLELSKQPDFKQSDCSNSYSIYLINETISMQPLNAL